MWGVGFRVEGLGFKVLGLGSRLGPQGSGIMAGPLGFSVLGV